jgi:hypothetical protein
MDFKPNITPDPELINVLFKIVGSAAFQHIGRPVQTHFGVLLTGNIVNNRYHHLRDSIEYRAGCAYYHHTLLQHILNLYESRAKKLEIFQDSGNLLEQLGNETRYIFDDIIFHCVSIYDYLASFIAYPYMDESAYEMNWNRIVKRCRDDYVVKDDRPDMNNKVFSHAVCVAHDSFVDKLQNYRAQLFHEKMDFIPSGIRQSIGNREFSTIQVGAPKLFLEIFRDEFEKYDSKKLSLFDISSWIYTKALTTAIEISELFRLQVGISSTQESFHSKIERMLRVRYTITVDELLRNQFL